MIETALTEWTLLLGSDRVSSDSPTLEKYSRSTLPKGTRSQAVLYPITTQEVSKVMLIAGRHQVPVYAISRGKNWGYGDACAVKDGQVIIDLSRMNKILEVNRELAYAVIEPGVSQGELSKYLKENNLPFWLDVTGAGPDASIVGNVIERGFGHTPNGDRFMMSCGYEVVLADGRILKTGFGHYENAKTSSIYKHGIGPSLDGIFTQSNFGIITRMTIWLMPIPEKFLFFAFSVKDKNKLPEVVDAIRDLRLSGLLASTVHIANDLRVFSQRMQYPWQRTDAKTPLPEDVREKMRKENGIGSWNGAGALYGTRDSVQAQKKALMQALKGQGELVFLDMEKLEFAKRVTKFLKSLGIMKSLHEKIQYAEIVLKLLTGTPLYQTLMGGAWRAKKKPDASTLDPLDNQWGFYWLSPVLPAQGKVALEFVHQVEEIFTRFGFEALITLSAVNPRALCCVMTVSYDKSSVEETHRAMECYEFLATFISDQGFPPYRTGIQSMKLLDRHSSVYWDVVHAIKKSLDPQEILASNRYSPKQI